MAGLERVELVCGEVLPELDQVRSVRLESVAGHPALQLEIAEKVVHELHEGCVRLRSLDYGL